MQQNEKFYVYKFSDKSYMKKKKLIPILLSFSLIFGTIFANAISINFEDIETDDISIEYEGLETEENIIENIDSSLATETTDTEEQIIEPESMELKPVQTYASRNPNFDMTVTAHTDGYGSVSLDWSSYDYQDKNFKVYKSSDEGVTYETVGIDYTLVNKVKCLQIYPISNASNQLKTWMETSGYGKGIIKIDSVHIDTFNANPDAYLKDSNGNYKYDVIFFGTWDENNGKDLSAKSKLSVEQYIKSGRGCITGHDTLCYSPGRQHVNFNSLASYFGIKFHNLYGNPNSYNNKSTNVRIIKKGLFTIYPWYIGEVGTVLTIPQAHNLGQRINNANKWLEFCNINSGCATAQSIDNYYLATYNNCANIMTGHSSGQATADEQKILANLIFYCNQLIFDTWYSKDSSAQDFANPNAPAANTTGSNFTWSATDNGSTYHYYVQSFDKNDTTETGLLDTSVTKSLTVTTGVRKYRYILDNSSSTIVTLSNGTETTATSIPENRNYNYLHIAAIDGAGNIGPTTTVEIPKTANVTVNHYKMNLDGSTYTLANTTTETAIIGTNYSGSIKTYTGFTSPAVQTKTIISGTNTINYYYTRNKYPVTYIDKTSDGKELGRTTKQVFYDADINGTDVGSNKSDNAYYPQYRLISSTNGKVTTEGATVYRVFEFCETEKESHLTWNDNNDTDNLRPEKYTLKLKQNGIVVDEVELPTDTTDYIFDHLPKYDTDGNPYVYEIEAIVSDRYKPEYGEDGSLIFQDYQPASFSVVIPKQIILDGNTGRANYTVSVDGVFYYNDNLTVKPEGSFILTDRSNISQMTGTVNQPKTNFIKSDLNSLYNGSISVDRINFSGLWNGSFNFDIKFEKKN